VARKPRIFISHSSKDDSYAGLVRDAVAQGLSDGFDVLLDAERLDPGDRWRAKLHRWLGVCDGAVLLFGPAALESDWVRKEATILTWRREFEREIRIVPAIFGGVRKQTLDDHGFAALQIEENQFARLSAAEEQSGTDGERAALLAQRIVKGFDGLAPLPGNSSMSLWVREVADMIRENTFLDQAADRLFEAADFEAGQDPVGSDRGAEFGVSAERVAYQILHSDPESIEQAFDELLRGQIRDQVKLVRLVTPSWVPAESAQAIAAAAERTTGRRLVALRANRTNTPDHVVLKGTCCDSRHVIVSAKSDRATTEEPEVELARLYRNDVLDKFGITDSRSASPEPEDVQRAQESFERSKKRMFVILRADATGCAVGRRLWGEFGFDRPVYVFAGDERETAEAAAGIEGIALVEPHLDAEQELLATIVANRMLGRAKGV
jgi:hypothetical protein